MSDPVATLTQSARGGVTRMGRDTKWLERAKRGSTRSRRDAPIRALHTKSRSRYIKGMNTPLWIGCTAIYCVIGLALLGSRDRRLNLSSIIWFIGIPAIPLFGPWAIFAVSLASFFFALLVFDEWLKRDRRYHPNQVNL
jgi:hypothetical protein